MKFCTRERQSDCMVAITRHTMPDTRPTVNMSDFKAFIGSWFNTRTVTVTIFVEHIHLESVVSTGTGGGPQGHREEGDWFSETPRRFFQESMPAVCCHGVWFCLGSERAFP